MKALKFIVYAPPYDENSGGSIVLHKLRDVLHDLGHTALLWPYGKRPLTWRGVHYIFFHALVRFSKAAWKRSGSDEARGYTSIAATADIEDGIVVYPEVVDGNPLYARRYVRWFLHSPEFHTGMDRDFAGELYFYFLEAFDVCLPKAVCGGRLALLEYFRNIYRLENFEPRSKVCYLIRKGKSRNDIPSLSGVWVLDGLDHKAMAMAFNECEICFIFDPYTLYATYAAMCGCIPVIVPLPGVAKEKWLPEEQFRFGLAYGQEDIPYALATRPQLIARLDQDEESGRESVRRFVDRVCEFFQQAKKQ